MDVERMAWTGQCGRCLSIVVIFPSDEAPVDIQEGVSQEWPEGAVDCVVVDCDGTIDWNGNEPVEEVIMPRRR